MEAAGVRHIKLDGPRIMALTMALADAFPNADDLDVMLHFTFGKGLAAITAPKSSLATALAVIQWVGARDQLPALFLAARDFVPTNQKLLRLAEELSLDEGQGEFERIVFKSAPPADVDAWRARMIACENMVCRVEVPPAGFDGLGRPVGTAFLVGPDVVVTNSHVVEQIRSAGIAAEKIVMRFDLKLDAEMRAVKPGKACAVAAAGVVLEESPKDRLDYAFLRIAEREGELPLPAPADAGPRGWLEPSAHAFAANEPICLIQHPNGTPLKFAFGAVISPAALPHRISYGASTDPGSSGSPCFTGTWDLVALHHWGGTEFNRGIPWTDILEDLGSKSRLDLLGRS